MFNGVLSACNIHFLCFCHSHCPFFFQIGDIVYARLCIANKDMEPELDCTDGSGKSAGLGQLSGGFMINCSLGLSRK